MQQAAYSKKNPGLFFLTQMLGWAFWVIFWGLFVQCLGKFVYILFYL